MRKLALMMATAVCVLSMNLVSPVVVLLSIGCFAGIAALAHLARV